MKKLLVIAVLAITASGTLFAGDTVSFNSFGNFMSGFIGRSKDIQDCRTVIQGDVSPLETAALAAATRGNTTDFNSIVTAITQVK